MSFTVISEYKYGHMIGHPKTIVEGTVVYRCLRSDYGLSFLDSVSDGEPYISVTLDPNGNYPFFTIPVRLLEPIIIQ